MIKRFGGNLAPLIGLCIAALVAATLASYVVVGQRFGIAPRTNVPDGGPLVLEQPEVSEPLILAGEPPQTAPEAPATTAIALAPSTPSDTEPVGDTDETFSGGLATDFSPTLTERVFGVIDSVTFQAGTIKASVKPDKDDDKKDKKDEDKDKDGDTPDDDAAPDEAVANGSNGGDDSVGDDEAGDALPDDDDDGSDSDSDSDSDDSDEDEVAATETDSKDKDKAPKDKKDKEPKGPKEPKEKKDKKEKDKDDDKGKP